MQIKLTERLDACGRVWYPGDILNTDKFPQAYEEWKRRRGGWGPPRDKMVRGHQVKVK